MTEASSERERIPEGFRYFPAYLTIDDQRALLEDIRIVVAQAPLYVPRMPRTGKALSVRMTNCGDLGWVTDQAGGYRYQPLHPATGQSWPAMPGSLLDLWRDLAGVDFPPEACLVNFYDADARMGLHQDKDEQNLDAPVLSISLGDDCRFRIGGTVRGGSTASLTLNSGDVVVLGGPARLAYHGVDRIYAGTSMLLKNGGRINLTLRRVTPIQTPGTES